MKNKIMAWLAFMGMIIWGVVMVSLYPLLWLLAVTMGDVQARDFIDAGRDFCAGIRDAVMEYKP